jgi:hydroxymethylglutaryl-CoA lyase
MRWPNRVRIREVGPRDGLQSESSTIATSDKIELIDSLSDTGLRFIEAVAFVSPRAVPQMADARAVWAGIDRRPEVFYSALVPNQRGAETAIDCGVDGIQVFIASTDSYNLKNVGRTVKESLLDVAKVAAAATSAGIPVAGTISTAFGCPYEGEVAPERVVELSSRLVDEGITSISCGDTTGMGSPRRVGEVVVALRTELPEVDINMHFHDTRGTGLANVVAALELGVDFFDASVGGMGGSPFATGATGNIATEDLVHMLIDMNIETGVDLDRLLGAADFAQGLVGAPLPGKLLRAGPRWQVAGPVRR